MSQPEISPLARRLAEENNVDWRGLHGSGTGGKVVERDVLEFLARVMAGEEDVDPTPEPVPEGMEGWPEEDVRSFQQEVQASRRDAGLDEIQRELSAADRSGNGAFDGDATLPSADEGAPLPDAEEISEDIFLFGDDGTDDGGERDALRASEASAGQPRDVGATGMQAADDELLVAGEEGAVDAGLEGAGAAAERVGDETFFESGRPDETAFGPAEGEPEGLPDVFGGAGDEGEEPRPSGDAALFEQEGAGAAEGAGEGLEMGSLGDVDAGEGAREGAGEETATYLQESARSTDGGWSADAAGGQETGFGTGAESAWDVDAGPVAGEPEEEAGADEANVGPEAEPPFGEPVPEPTGVEGAAEPVSAEGEAPTAGEPEVPERVPYGSDVASGAEAGPGEEPLVAGAATGAEAPSAPRELPLVTYGTLLRRHLDVTALAGAQLAVGLELGESEPLSPAAFLVRAAAKAVAEDDWGEGPVAMVALEGDAGVTPRVVEDAAGRPFVDLVRALGSGEVAAADAHAALNVVDMSALDVDEAVLDVGGPLLTLGRILYDNQRGSYRSTLSLAGDVPAERGARLLARVAELLDAPVRLLL